MMGSEPFDFSNFLKSVAPDLSPPRDVRAHLPSGVEPSSADSSVLLPSKDFSLPDFGHREGTSQTVNSSVLGSGHRGPRGIGKPLPSGSALTVRLGDTPEEAPQLPEKTITKLKADVLNAESEESLRRIAVNRRCATGPMHCWRSNLGPQLWLRTVSCFLSYSFIEQIRGQGVLQAID